MKEVSKEAVMEALERNVKDIKSGKSDWSIIADYFVIWLSKNPDTESFDDFVWYIQTNEPDWINEDVTWDPFFGIHSKGATLRFIDSWVNEEDIPAFMDFIKKQSEELWKFLTDPEIGEDEV